MLVPYSTTVLAAHVKKKTVVPLLRLLILHIIEQHHKLKLKESTEIKNPITKITYVTVIGDNEIRVKLFMLYILIYYTEAELRRELPDGKANEMNRRAHIGIDYEFRQRVIALMQICFECVADSTLGTNNYIWLVNPGEFKTEDMHLLNTYIMTNPTIYKILHGSDSLDIPYMYKEMFGGNKEYILKFTSRMFDTRFLCEYYRQSVGDDKRCSIYFALEYFGVITKKHHEYLEAEEFKMGHKADQSWEIRKMSSYHIKYALYDVLFLQHFLVAMLRHIKENTPQYVDTYKYIIPMIRFMFIDRKEIDGKHITEVLETAKTIINPINNYLVRHKGKNFTLITIYNTVIENFKIHSKNINVDFMLSVSYFKKSFGILLKFLMYITIQENFTVWKNKNNKMNEELSVAPVYDILKENYFERMLEFCTLYKNEVRKKLLVLYR